MSTAGPRRLCEGGPRTIKIPEVVLFQWRLARLTFCVPVFPPVLAPVSSVPALGGLASPTARWSVSPARAVLNVTRSTSWGQESG